jgi:hypothetical protein
LPFGIADGRIVLQRHVDTIFQSQRPAILGGGCACRYYNNATREKCFKRFHVHHSLLGDLFTAKLLIHAAGQLKIDFIATAITT